MFDVDIKKHVRYKNYVANKPIDGRVILNGNRLFFLEPLESSSTQTYFEWIKMTWDYIFGNQKDPSEDIKKYINQYIPHFMKCNLNIHYPKDYPFKPPKWKLESYKCSINKKQNIEIQSVSCCFPLNHSSKFKVRTLQSNNQSLQYTSTSISPDS